MSQKIINRWVVVLGAVMISMCLGAVYTWSLFNQPLIEKYGWNSEGVVLTFSITIATFAFFTIIGGKLQDKMGPRLVATAGGILLGIGLMLASQANTLTQMYLFYGVVGGIGIGIAYVCPLATCLKWFPDKRGLISGIAVAGFGAGALVFKPIILYLIPVFGVSNTFFYLGIIYLVIIVLGSQLLVVPPKGYIPEGWTPPTTTSANGNDFTTGQMLATHQFYMLWIIYLFGCMAGLMVISLAADIGMGLVKLDAITAANAVTIIALFNAAGRITWGKVSDKIGRIPTLLMMYVLTLITMLFMGLVPMGYATYMVAVSLVGFCFGGFLSVFPSITADYFGTKNLGTNYGIIFMAYGLSAIVGPVVATTVGFTQSFLISAVLCAISAGVAYTLKQPTLEAAAVPRSSVS